MNICPQCKTENDDNWPLKIGTEIIIGGCQTCWEDQCSESWWHMIDIFMAGG